MTFAGSTEVERLSRNSLRVSKRNAGGMGTFSARKRVERSESGSKTRSYCFRCLVCSYREKRNDDLSAEALAKAEAIHLKFQLDCRSCQASFAMTS